MQKQIPKTKFFWDFLYTKNKETIDSLNEYDSMHKQEFGGPNDGSYEILSNIAKGNITLDIASGEGLIEKLSSETVALEFSKNALKKAKANGAKFLIRADSHFLPFKDNAFEIAISAGSIEQFSNPQKAISEMVRVSKIQVLTVHREFNFPLASVLRSLITNLTQTKNQPIEKPLTWNQLETMLKKTRTNIIFKGYWTLPVNYGRIFKFLPEFKNIPSCFFVICFKK